MRYLGARHTFHCQTVQQISHRTSSSESAGLPPPVLGIANLSAALHALAGAVT
jgi:hypothetical protein